MMFGHSFSRETDDNHGRGWPELFFAISPAQPKCYELEDRCNDCPRDHHQKECPEFKSVPMRIWHGNDRPKHPERCETIEEIEQEMEASLLDLHLSAKNESWDDETVRHEDFGKEDRKPDWVDYAIELFAMAVFVVLVVLWIVLMVG